VYWHTGWCKNASHFRNINSSVKPSKRSSRILIVGITYSTRDLICDVASYFDVGKVSVYERLFVKFHRKRWRRSGILSLLRRADATGLENWFHLHFRRLSCTALRVRHSYRTHKLLRKEYLMPLDSIAVLDWYCNLTKNLTSLVGFYTI